MRWISCRAADFIKVTPGGEICKVHPPTLMVKSLLALGGWDGIPHLTGLIQSPIIHLDGHITMVRGYDEVSEFYYDPGPALELPDIPEAPTKEEIQEAVSFLCEPFIDFPFYDDNAGQKIEKKLYGRHGQNLMKTDIKEMEDGYELEMDLPGFKKE